MRHGASTCCLGIAEEQGTYARAVGTTGGWRVAAETPGAALRTLPLYS